MSSAKWRQFCLSLNVSIKPVLVQVMSWFRAGMHQSITWTNHDDVIKWKHFPRYTETQMSSFWRNFHHWLHRKLSKWQLSVQSVIKISSKWQQFRFSELLAIYVGNSPVPGKFPIQRPVTRSFDVFFDLPLNKRLSKQSWGWWFETPSRPLWRHGYGWFRW